MQNFIADVLIGNFIMGNQLKIRNAANTVTLDESGILIKVPKPEGDDETVFQADNAGNVMLKGTIYATSGAIGGLTIAENGIGVKSEEGEFALVFDENGISSLNGSFSLTAGGVLTAKSGTIGGLTLSENSISASNLFSVNSAGKLTAKDADISGVITAKSGTIGGFTITEDGFSFIDGEYEIDFSHDGMKIGNVFEIDRHGNVDCNKLSISYSAGVNQDYELKLTEDEILIMQSTNGTSPPKVLAQAKITLGMGDANIYLSGGGPGWFKITAENQLTEITTNSGAGIRFSSDGGNLFGNWTLNGQEIKTID